jgi:hypothetical protein
MTTSKKQAGRKLVALVVFGNQTVERAAYLRPFESLPPTSQRNVEALGLDGRFARRRDLPARFGQPFGGERGESKARKAAERAGFEVITYQELTFRRARQATAKPAAKKGSGRR